LHGIATHNKQIQIVTQSVDNYPVFELFKTIHHFEIFAPKFEIEKFHSQLIGKNGTYTVIRHFFDKQQPGNLIVE